MTQKPMLHVEVYARALRASQNRKEDSVQRAGSMILPPPSKVEIVHEIILKPNLSRFCVCFCIEESTPLFGLLGTPRQEPPLLLWGGSGVAPRWPQLRFSNVEWRFRNERTRTRTNTNPNDTEANAAGRSVRACVARKSKS